LSVAVLLVVGGQIQQWHRAEPESGQRRADEAVPSDLGQRRCDLGQAEAVAAQSFGHR
jgi:hypothetical protein